MTDGFDVLVQLVMAAITTEPSRIVDFDPLVAISAGFCAELKVSRKFFFTSGRLMRSCGRLGPAMEGTTLPRSSSKASEYSGSGESGVRNRPCALAYASTSAISSAERLVRRR